MSIKIKHESETDLIPSYLFVVRQIKCNEFLFNDIIFLPADTAILSIGI